MSERIGVVIGGFSESGHVLEPYAEAMVEHGIVRDAVVKTAAEYRQAPVSDEVAAEALFLPHSAGTIVLAESFRTDPRKYVSSGIVAQNGVEPRGFVNQAIGALKVFGQKIEPEDQLPDDISAMRYPAGELVRHLATTVWIPRQVRTFSTGNFLVRASSFGGFQAGAAALYSDDDPFGFTPNESGVDWLNNCGVFSYIFPGGHNRVLLQPKYAATMIAEKVPFVHVT